MLDGQVVNYNRMYDVPLRFRSGGARAGGMVYRGIGEEERELR